LSGKGKFNYKNACLTIRAQQKDSPVSCELDLLPKYASAGGWSDAATDGKKLMRGF